MKIFDIEIKTKTHFCSLNGRKTTKVIEPYINIYVRLTNRCQADCAFCQYKNNKCTNTFDFYKFYFAICEIRKQVKINKISFTGGEPTLLLPELMQCTDFIKRLDKDIFVVVNTNGFNLTRFNADNIKNIDSIALSRHATKDVDNYAIFKTSDIPSRENLEKLPEIIKNKIHISCNLIKEQIHNAKTISDFITAYSNIGFYDFGFVSLMKINKHCEEQFIDFSDIDFSSIDNMMNVKSWNKNNSCKCKNYLYCTSSGEISKVYCRYYCDNNNVESTLVYDINVLKNGFNGITIF